MLRKMVVMDVKPVEKDVDAMAMRVFLKSIELLGGPRKLVEHRKLTWLPSLMSASYAVIYAEESNYTAEKIASILGLTKQTVQNILRADTEAVKTKIEEEERGEESKESEEKRTHIAGALAKMAYKEIMAGNDEINLALEITRQVVASIGAEWAMHVLSRIKVADFPADKETLKNKLAGLVIKGKNVEEILEKLEYPIRNPSELLRKIGNALQ